MSFLRTTCILVIALLSKSTDSNSLSPRDIVIVVLSQKEGYHAAHAEILKKGIIEQSDAVDKDPPEVVLTHELNINGSWIIIPLLHHLSDMYPNSKWFFFCMESTVIRLYKLLSILSKFKETKNLWIGHALYDHEPTIIHHFAEHNKKFKYPHIASGFAITSALLNSMVQKIIEDYRPKDDFSIDASYEFALFALKIGNGVQLTHVPEICIVSSSYCATYPKSFHPCSPSVSSQEVYFAVKTCMKYHEDRMLIIRNTWAKYASNIGYYSDSAGIIIQYMVNTLTGVVIHALLHSASGYQTVLGILLAISDKHVPDAFIVPNTTEGHCAKTYSILVEADKVLKQKNLKWLIISDDDTLFSVVRLLRLLTCYNWKNPSAIGERYGFRVWDSLYGYDYLTGGAGLVLSASLVHDIIVSGKCKCPTPTTPDDMYLFGICLQRIGVEPVHSPLFHQARPSDYATAYLASQEPISFHKFWMIEPQAVYNEWFAEADQSLLTTKRHTEL